MYLLPLSSYVPVGQKDLVTSESINGLTFLFNYVSRLSVRLTSLFTGKTHANICTLCNKEARIDFISQWKKCQQNHLSCFLWGYEIGRSAVMAAHSYVTLMFHRGKAEYISLKASNP